jgi:hypothetical protein
LQKEKQVEQSAAGEQNPKRFFQTDGENRGIHTYEALYLNTADICGNI